MMTNLTEQGDIGRSRGEAGVRTKALDEGWRCRNLRIVIMINYYVRMIIIMIN